MSRRRKAARAEGLKCPRCGNTYITKQGLYFQCSIDPALLDKREYLETPPGSHSCGFFGDKHEFSIQRTL